MTTISVNHKKTKFYSTPGFVLFFAVSVCILLAVGYFTRGADLSAGNEKFLNQTLGAPVATQNAFSADLEYWNANCSHGWSSDSECDAIVLRANSCTFNSASAYCSSYEKYMREILEKKNRASF